MNDNWSSLASGVLVSLIGTLMLVTGQDMWNWDFPVPAWAGWIFVPIGIIVTISSILTLWRGRENKSPYSEQDVERAKAVLARMYLREHGALPKEKTPEETPKEEAPRSKGISMIYCGGIVFGVVLFVYGMRVLRTGNSGSYWNSSLPSRAGAGLAFIGIFTAASAIWELWCDRKKKPQSSKQDAERAKAALPRVPLPKHHSPPTEKTPKEAPKATPEETPKEKAPRQEDSSRQGL